ncbi:MAG: type IV pili twitching motility protein PilT, partial [Deinococcota bacterium]|nr:type IV pili twitching motility protein PilT [Deinococcota bacterium]
MTLDDMLAQFVKMGASDIHLHAGLKPMVRVSGRLLPVGQQVLAPALTASFVDLMCDERKRAVFADKHQVDTAFS